MSSVPCFASEPGLPGTRRLFTGQSGDLSLETLAWIRFNAIPQFRPGQEIPCQVYATCNNNSWTVDREGERGKPGRTGRIGT